MQLKQKYLNMKTRILRLFGKNHSFKGLLEYSVKLETGNKNFETALSVSESKAIMMTK